MKAENIQDIYELSPVQQGILFHNLYEPESAVYFVQLCYVIRGNLNVAAFEKAWLETIARHTILRTSFYWENLDKPVQVVHLKVDFAIVQQDWRGTANHEQRLQEFLEGDRTLGFDFSQPCLMRLNLIQVADDTYYLIWSKHHLILDGWSTALVLKEVIELYTALCRGENSLGTNCTFYGDYIGWLQQQDLTQAEKFWRQMLSGLKAPTSLGHLERKYSSQQKSTYHEQRLQLSIATTAALKSFAREHKLTLNTIFQAAWVVLLSRYSGQDDVVYGSTVSGRPPNLPQAESMVGMFINTLPIRVQLDQDMLLLPWLRQLQNQLLEVRQYEYSPLVEIQGWSDIPRGVPLFESILVYENYPVAQILKNQQQNIEFQTISAFDYSNYPLTISVFPGEELELIIGYNCKFFDNSTVNRILGHFETVLHGMVNHPHVRLKDLPLLTTSEQHQLLIEWNQTQAEYPQNLCIHQLFEEQVVKTPDAIAVVFDGESLTYSELNQQANQIAHYLQSIGVKPEQLVGICVERSLTMLVGILGILKAGGAYVPLDPNQPVQRLAFMLQDTACKVLLTQKRLTAQLPPHTAQVIYLDADGDLIAQQSTSQASCQNLSPENLAYVIYTSGSTGQAKGVMVEHRSLVNAYLSWEKVYQLRSPIRTHLQMANFSFDVFSGDWIRALCSGGKLVLCPQEFLLEPDKLYTLMRQQQVDCAEFVPMVLRHLIQYLEQNQQRLDFMKLLICGSDSWYTGEYNKFRRFLGDKTRLINSFGVTEATIDSSYFESGKANFTGEQLVPIGRPFANTQLYILNADLQPVPIGVVGELYIAGVSLARGYYNRPELTSQKFIPNPFSHQPGTRLYKTGDLVRYLPDGNIEFLGRADYQVKIRGFRIELEEIEAVLSQHPKVEKAVVIVQEEPDNKRLVAYIMQNTPTSGQELLQQLRDFLRERLPEYMIPANFVPQSSLPLLPNGKINRQALALIEPTKLDFTASYLAPQNAVEEVLAGIWAKVLRVEQVGIHDNFFDLGGHSLLATQVISRIREALQIELPLRCLFESPTVAQLSANIIAQEIKPGRTEKIAQIWQKLEVMSTEEAKQALENRKAAKQVGV